MSPAMRHGIAVHKAIDSVIKKTGLQVDTPLTQAERALNWLDKKGYEVLGSEIKHLAPIAEDMQVFGIIDALVRECPGGRVLAIDWKTSRSLWTVTQSTDGEFYYIGTKGWQGPIYLTTPYESDIVSLQEWPTTMIYVVITEAGGVESYEYHKNLIDDKALANALELMKTAEEMGNFPKNIGTYTCNDCDFKYVCHQIPGWEKYYDERKRRQS